ncbi:MAG: TonB-dependent receptor [Verrucomicrobiales bacterium]|nr:TonB-dependent receptor [Verrucomicrobiales bacterium]
MSRREYFIQNPQTPRPILFGPLGRALRIARLLLWFAVLPIAGSSQVEAQPAVGPAVIVETEGTVETFHSGANAWKTAQPNLPLPAGTRVQTRQKSRAVVRLSDQSLLRLGEETIIEIPQPTGNRVLQFLKGALYYFHRDKPGVMPVKTPTAYAVVIGTEFEAAVDPNGATILHLIDGRVEISNDLGQLALKAGESASVPAGQAPTRTAALQLSSTVQWALYYPGVLNLDDLKLDEDALRPTLSAYRAGDLLGAISNYPVGRQPASMDERIFYAGLLLAVGRAEECKTRLASIEADAGQDARMKELGEDLQLVIAAVQGQSRPRNYPSTVSSSYLADSIYLQSQSRLNEALLGAYRAVQVAPGFGFGWARVAELEFSFGRRTQASVAVQKSLSLAPRNAEAVALRGFLQAARGQWNMAFHEFDQAITMDGALGNAWLGRGLCQIRLGHAEQGRQDLQTAATLEPQRALLRSYLGKAFANEGDYSHAENEMRLGRSLDPKDPTAWLYSGLLNFQENRINDAVRDLERSSDLNGNRSVYRSRLLLDQDQGMRSANLALAYQDAGMSDWALQEAARSVVYDPANYSAHLFLGNSFQLLRDPNGINQRFETPAVNEYLLAGLLAPPSGGILAQSVSQQEYSRFFEKDGAGLSSSTEYLSRGDWLEAGSVYGSVPNLGYALSGFYRSQAGWRTNNDLTQTELSLQLKHQLTSKDSFYFRASWGELESGDLLQRYDPATANTGLRVKERQEPLLLAGYHREWQPGMHTLVLGGWFKDDQRVFDPQSQTLVQGRDASGGITDVLPVSFEQHYRAKSDLFTAEAQQLWQTEEHTLIAGGRVQGGTFQVDNLHTNATFPFPFLFPSTNVDTRSSMQRYSLYAYHQWRPFSPILFVAGLSYDHLRYPSDFRFAPLTVSESHTDQISPKGGIVWTPREQTAVRAGYSRSLGGVSFDQSFRLEPTQVAGFNQAFRSLIPESVAGANSAADFETWGLAWQERVLTNTWLTVSGEWLNSRVRRQLGAYDFAAFTVTSGSTSEKLDFRERSISLSANQLVGREWAFGAQYRLSEAQLRSVFLDVPANATVSGGFRQNSAPEALLHRVNLFASYNHASGFFGEGQALWLHQSNRGYSQALPGDDFWQLNAFAGYRLWHRRAEVTLGILNITDQDYRINPLNLAPELPRERTFMLALRLNF